MAKTPRTRALATFGLNVRKRREALKLSQLEAAEKAGPLRIARVEFFVGELTHVRPPRRLAGESPQGARPTAPLSPPPPGSTWTPPLSSPDPAPAAKREAPRAGLPTFAISSM